MKILVSGGAGFIGSQYVRMILDGSFPALTTAQVTVIDKLTYAGNLANLRTISGQERLRFIEGDICDGELLASVVSGHDLVINFAAETHVDRSINSAAAFVETNVKGVQVLLEACATALPLPRFLQISTDEVYGSIQTGSCAEEATLAPSSPYAATKAGGDLVALSYACTYGMDVRVTRCCNNYGPFQYPEKIIPLFITRLLSEQKVPIYGDGKNVRSWIHVEDHCRGIQLVIDEGRPGEIYNIQADQELTNIQLTDALLRSCGCDWSSVQYVQDRKGHDRRYSPDDSKLRKLGYSSSIPFDVGLAETLHWYKDNRSWWEPLT